MLRIFPAILMILSGSIIPLAFFPDWAQTALRILPFSGLVDIPFRIYLGSVPVNQIFYLLALQLFWIGILIGIGLKLLEAGMRRVVVQGG